MSNPTTEQFSRLRKAADGADNFMKGCAVLGNPYSGNKQRAMNPPEWAINQKLLQEVVLRAFPRWNSDKREERRALLWLEIIYNFYHRGLPART